MAAKILLNTGINIIWGMPRARVMATGKSQI